MTARWSGFDRRPLIILNNGYDATITDTYFASAVAASRRGYHSLLFDGPGQGAMLYEHGVPLRPDWEVVVTAVVDFALTLARVDPGASRSTAGALADISRPAVPRASRASPPSSPIPPSGASPTASGR